MGTVIPKPQDSRWTDEQWQAIVTRGEDVLVAAAAGSGKTAVLIERIIRIITDEQAPADVDRLLVATFTKAAADEMRHRMREALEKQLTMQPDSAHLRRQLTLIHRASITTLHSFCMDVIAKHYYKIALDPSFRIANETEAELLRQDVIEELFERYYRESEETSAFWGLLDRYGGARSDDALFSLVQRLYDFSRSHPFPDVWLRGAAEQFRSFDGDLSHPLMQELMNDCKLTLEGVYELLLQAADMTRLPGGPAVYADMLIEEEQMVASALGAVDSGSWDTVHALFETIVFGKLKPARGDDLDKTIQERVKALRDKAKKQISELREQMFARTPEQYMEEMQQIAPFMELLAQLVIEFGERYSEAKQGKRLVDFSDLEHYCLRVLCEGVAADGRLIPTAAAEQYREHFVEVLVDEYQDTNQVQEAILSLVSRTGPGNRFMVGDVKQSIYRFRLADPSIFLSKYKTYHYAQSDPGGTAIDLARNFRSRQQVVDGVNYIFKQIMEERAAEITYDDEAELKYGANYPEPAGGYAANEIDLYLVHRQGGGVEGESASDESSELSDEESASSLSATEAHELETAELEARLIGLKIRELVGADGQMPYQVNIDRERGLFRDATYQDIVILVRATKASAPIFVEQLRAAGVPAYAELSSGYFEAIEVDVMLSLLKVIDNPLQDIPLAGVLRSPIVGLNAEELAFIRLSDKTATYYESMLRLLGDSEQPEFAELRDKLLQFADQLSVWREEARTGLLSDLLWQIYRETGYYDYVGGLPGGTQRQANLKALYDRCRQYESTSLRGLFRFLRFIKRMQESGSDLGAAKAMSEQEDVVRIMSIHKSKGLEFPIVLVAGMSKMFNQRDLSSDFLMHKELGIGPMVVDPVLRNSYPSIASLAIKRRMRMEMLAEEMRILYVALTRAKEKLILIGTTRDIEKQLQKWSASLAERALLLPASTVTSARTYLDWVGAAIIRHPALREIREAWHLGGSRLVDAEQQTSRFKLHIMPQGRLAAWQEAAAGRAAVDAKRMERVASLEAVSLRAQSALHLPASVLAEDAKLQQAVASRLEWAYPYQQAERYYSKTSVTEIKRLKELTMPTGEEPEPVIDIPGVIQEKRRSGVYRRPKFMETKQLNAAERGTVYHAIMQQLPLDPEMSLDKIEATMRRMIELEIVRADQLSDMDPSLLMSFFESEIGQRLMRASFVRKELPFSYGLRVGELHPDTEAEIADETVIIQGVIDCLFEEEDGLVLLDYKTDQVKGNPHQAAQRYVTQLELYARAISEIMGKPVKNKVLYFFDGGHVVEL